MGLRLTERWVWDFWHVLDGADHHLFYLQAPRTPGDPEARHWNVSIGHAVSEDLRTWTVLEDALAPAAEGAWDDYTTWTGCVIGHEERWWMFYTGTNRRENGLVQRVGLATSHDLVTWERHGHEPLIELDPRWYEELDLSIWHDQAWRDPWVYRDTDGLFHVLVTARVNHGPPATRGVIGHAVSEDLLRWEVLPPLTSPGAFGHLEIPQTVEVGGHWWLLFSTPAAAPLVQPSYPGSEIAGTHVLRAEDPLGPYDWSTHQLLDGDVTGSRYGGRVVPDGAGGNMLLTWLLGDGKGGFVGEVADPLPVTVEADRLVVRRP
jgi:beta-fructofuranosidase